MPFLPVAFEGGLIADDDSRASDEASLRLLSLLLAASDLDLPSLSRDPSIREDNASRALPEAETMLSHAPSWNTRAREARSDISSIAPSKLGRSYAFTA